MSSIIKIISILTVSVLYFANANAANLACPEGCFCLDNGSYSNTTYHSDVIARCGKGASILPKGSPNSVSKLLTGVDGYLDTEYFVTKMVKNEEQYINYYGVKNGTFYGDRISGNVFVCPITHPHSAKGSKQLTDCFQYGANGNKIYYGNNNYVNNNYVNNNTSNTYANYDIDGIKTLVVELQDVSNKINRIASQLQQILKANNVATAAPTINEPTNYSTSSNTYVEQKQTQPSTNTGNSMFKSSILNSYAGIR